MNTDTPTTAPETHAEFAAGLTAPTAAAKSTRNVLTTTQIVRLWNWCETNKASLPTLPNTQLAQIAAAELQFPITPANIANMLAEMHIEKRKPDAPPTVEERLMRVESLLFNEQGQPHSWLRAALLPTEDSFPPPPPADHPELNIGSIPVPA